MWAQPGSSDDEHADEMRAARLWSSWLQCQCEDDTHGCEDGDDYNDEEEDEDDDDDDDNDYGDGDDGGGDYSHSDGD